MQGEDWENWSEPAKAELLRMLESADRKRIWYCDRGRACDGRPHEGVAYPHARGSQWPPPGHWLTWLMSSGRGSGKTRSAAEWVRKRSANVGRIALVGATGPDLRETMIEGESGLIYVCERAGAPGKWEPSRRRFTFANGAIATGFSSEEPDRLRGPQHGLAWADEPAHWENLEETWDNLLLGLRLGRMPQIAATTTPLPSKWMKTTAAAETTVVTRESTYANLDNLAPTFAQVVLARYEGTRQGRQELHGEILEDVEGALWQSRFIDDHRVERAPDLVRVVVGVDPAGTSTRRSDETGIVVVGIDEEGEVYVLADYSGTYSPAAWADKVAWAHDRHQADEVVAENNYGGEMVSATLENANLAMKVTEVNSRRGKLIRAEPVEALYEKGKVHHVGIPSPSPDVPFHLEALETQMVEWIPGTGSSPDRLDALVHGVHAVIDRPGLASAAIPHGRIGAPAGRRRGGVDVTGDLAPVVALHAPRRRGEVDRAANG